MAIGKINRRIARKKLSARKPRSRKLSPRARCDWIMSANASAMGTAPTNLLSPAKGTIVQETINTEEMTDTISQAASVLSSILTSAVLISFCFSTSLAAAHLRSPSGPILHRIFANAEGDRPAQKL